MKKNYELSGMSCGGCVNSVRKILSQLPDVTEVDVQLNPPNAVLTMNRYIPVEELQAQLNRSGGYTIKEIVAKT